MKITKTKLKQIIKEEIEQGVRARSNISLSRDQAQNIRQTQNRAQKIIKFLTSTDPDDVEQGLTILDTLEDQQLIDAIASHFTFDSKSNSITTRRGFKIPEETFGMLLNYFAEKSDRVKNMLAQIENLVINYNNFITNFDFLRFCTNLTTLDLRGCKSMENVDALQGLTNLTKLDLSLCKSLENVDGLKGCTNLNWLDLSLCKSLENVDALQGLTNLTELHLSHCHSLQNVDGIQGLTNLTYLDLEGCESLQNVDGLQGLMNLTELDLSWCLSLPRKLQTWFINDEYSTAYEQFMKVLNESKGNQP